MAKTAGKVLEAVVAAACVVGSLLLLSWLEELPMPKMASMITLSRLEDVKFYAPPMGAIAVIIFSAPSLPALETIVVGIVSSTVGAVTLVSLLGPGVLTRALSCGLAMFIMKMTGRIYGPAGALAVLLVDNAKMQELGIFYCLMPGLTGTAVLVLLAAAKIELLKALQPVFKQCDPSGELTGPLLPYANKGK
mmetsp:Transcript_68415/g.189330  ORF Transcript_68415/g.189330 Transcript_68415/m.189330 type:complete len:192 (+) Transcript_68415:110-685(+)